MSTNISIIFKTRDTRKKERIIKHIVRIIARFSLCLGCRLCELVCPTNAISIKLEKNKYIINIDPKLCTGCLLCNNLCPVGIFYEKAVKNSYST